MLLDHAPGLDTARFRQFAAEVAYRADPVPRMSGRSGGWEKRHLSFGLTLDSTGVLSGSCGDAVSYEIVRTAAEAFSPPGVTADARTAAQRRMDGLVAACQAALDGGSALERHGSAPHVTVLLKDETLAQAAAAAAARTAPGRAQPAAAAGTAPVTGASPGRVTGASPGLVTGASPGLVAGASPGLVAAGALRAGPGMAPC